LEFAVFIISTSKHVRKGKHSKDVTDEPALDVAPCNLFNVANWVEVVISPVLCDKIYLIGSGI
jgi:hypothetical protein